MDSDRILCWNARGLNNRAHHDLVASLIVQHNVSLLCIKESKLHVIDDSLILSMLSAGFAYDFVPAVGTRGGILVAWKSARWNVSHGLHTPHALTLKLSPPRLRPHHVGG
jgi:exonuclease III